VGIQADIEIIYESPALCAVALEKHRITWGYLPG
jgi:hypothetical protein